MRRSSITTSRSGATISSVSTRPVIRSASNDIIDAEMLLGDALEIGGVVVAGEGVLLAADLGDRFGEGALGMGLGALEHEMLEEMRDARLARRIVGRAVAIPDHVGDDRRAVVRDHNHGQAIVQAIIGNAGPSAGAAPGASGVRLGIEAGGVITASRFLATVPLWRGTPHIGRLFVRRQSVALRQSRRIGRRGAATSRLAGLTSNRP